MYVVELLTKVPIGLEIPQVTSHQDIQVSTCTNHLMLHDRAANILHLADHQELNQAAKHCKKVALKWLKLSKSQLFWLF